MKKPSVDHFTAEQAEGYDEKNKALAPISESLHFLTSLILERLPVDSKILSVGAGTGAEILSLGKAFPDWSFVAVDPSLAMLNICRKRIQSAGLLDRCEFVHGSVQDLPAQADFDAAIAFLVAHFIAIEERVEFFKNITGRLRFGGYLVNAEISFDLESKEFPFMLQNWQTVQRIVGGTPESLKALPQQFKEVLTVLSPDETQSIIRKSGINFPVKYFQAFMISAWYGVKENKSLS